MGGRGEKQRQEAERSRVLQVAAEIFAERGCARTSLAAIGRALGRNPRHPTYYFADKQTLVATVMERHLEQLLGAVGLAEDWPGPPWRRLRLMLGRLIAAIAAAPAAHQVLLSEQRWLGAAAGAVQAKQRWLCAVFEDALERARPALATADGDGRPASATIAAALVGCALHQPLWSPDAPVAAQLARAAAMLAPLLAAARASRNGPGVGPGASVPAVPAPPNSPLAPAAMAPPYGAAGVLAAGDMRGEVTPADAIRPTNAAAPTPAEPPRRGRRRDPRDPPGMVPRPGLPPAGPPLPKRIAAASPRACGGGGTEAKATKAGAAGAEAFESGALGGGATGAGATSGTTAGAEAIGLGETGVGATGSGPSGSGPSGIGPTGIARSGADATRRGLTIPGLSDLQSPPGLPGCRIGLPLPPDRP